VYSTRTEITTAKKKKEKRKQPLTRFGLDRAEAFASKPMRDDNAARGGQPCTGTLRLHRSRPIIASTPEVLPSPLLLPSDVEVVEAESSRVGGGSVSGVYPILTPEGRGMSGHPSFHTAS
jgi:hypothetical protein